MVDRRIVLKGIAALACGMLAAGTARRVLAAASADVSGREPGFFRLSVGDVEVTALLDGGGTIAPEILHGAPPQEIDTLLRHAGIDPQQGAPVDINAFLIRSGAHLLLVDTGAGTAFGKRAGLLPQSIRAAGCDPREIGVVLLTHLHADHARGLVDGAGNALFPQARVRVHEAEAAYWLGDGAEQRVSKRSLTGLAALAAAVAPYKEAGRFTTFATGETPAPGVEAVFLPGHTPGHCGYRIASKGESILFWGDIVHCLAVQFPRPEVSIDYDVDQAAAVATRKPLMASLAGGREWVAGAHLPFPGLGRVTAAGTGYAWQPARQAE